MTVPNLPGEPTIVSYRLEPQGRRWVPQRNAIAVVAPRNWTDTARLRHSVHRNDPAIWGRENSMSNFAALGLIIATLFTTNVIAVWTLDRCTTRAAQVLNGVHEGMPMPTEFRRFLIFQNVLPAMASVAFLDILGAFVMLGAARSLPPDAGIQWIAYAASLWNVLAAFQWLVGGGILVLYLVSVVRSSESN